MEDLALERRIGGQRGEGLHGGGGGARAQRRDDGSTHGEIAALCAQRERLHDAIVLRAVREPDAGCRGHVVADERLHRAEPRARVHEDERLRRGAAQPRVPLAERRHGDLGHAPVAQLAERDHARGAEPGFARPGAAAQRVERAQIAARDHGAHDERRARRRRRRRPPGLTGGGERLHRGDLRDAGRARVDRQRVDGTALTTRRQRHRRELPRERRLRLRIDAAPIRRRRRRRQSHERVERFDDRGLGAEGCEHARGDDGHARISVHGAGRGRGLDEHVEGALRLFALRRTWLLGAGLADERRGDAPRPLEPAHALFDLEEPTRREATTAP